jgi:hypothetical protein
LREWLFDIRVHRAACNALQCIAFVGDRVTFDSGERNSIDLHQLRERAHTRSLRSIGEIFPIGID